MGAEQLIALEAAQQELATLYTVAQSFTALRQQAELELLPRLITLGHRWRGLARAAQLTPDELDAAAREIQTLRTSWRAVLEQVRTSDPYQRAVAALAADRQGDLAQLIPLVFADLRRIDPSPSLYFPVSPSTGRRRPGTSPFLSAPACADKIVQLLAQGIVPDAGGAEWWECELPAIGCADALAALETPIALRLAAMSVRVALFESNDAGGLRVFTPCLRAPMSIVLAGEATDEWWDAYQDSYRSFRDALRQELATRGHAAVIAAA